MRNKSWLRGRRRGITATLAMLYLIIFSTLAVGFYATFSLARQSSYNDRDARRALAAAESGMEFIRQRLYDLNIAYSSSTADLFDRVETGLRSQLDGSQNLDGGSIVRSGGMLLVPGDSTKFIELDETGMGFRVEITGDDKQLVVTVTGRSSDSASAGDVLRAVQLRYAMLERPSSIFNFGIASRSPISMDSNAQIIGTPNAAHGSVLSTSLQAGPAVSIQGNSSISGDVSLVNPSGSASIGSSASIAGTSNSMIQADHIHTGVAEPEFPTIDTDVYKKFATNVVSTAGAKFDTTNVQNLYIKANVNPIFSGDIKVQGVIYIETPNKVSFDSNVEITGVIVGQNNPTGSLTQNQITFDSNVKLRGVQYLPDTPDFPQELRDMVGSTILAPGFYLDFDSNFGGECGSVVGSQIAFNSNAVGTINGSVLNLADTSVSLNSNTAITIANQGTSFAPAGMYFGSRYIPLPASYKELLP